MKQTQPISTVPTRDYSLDLLRGIAALWVFFYHLAPHLAQSQNLLGLPILGSVLRQGWMGVDIFVVLSGFVIMRVLAVAARAPNRGLALIGYGINRFCRLAPLHYVTIGVALLVLPAGTVGAGQLWSNLLFVQNLTQQFPPIVGPSWTIALEAQWYVVAPLVLVALLHLGPVPICAASLGISVCWIAGVFANLELPATDPAYGNEVVRLASQLPGMAFHFGLGAVIALYDWNEIPRPLHRVAFFVGLASLLVAVVVMDIVSQAWIAGRQSAIYAFAYGRLLIALATALLIGGALSFAMPDWMAGLSKIGAISYGIYLWHDVVFQAQIHFGIGIGLLGSTAAVVAVSTVSWNLLERPVIRLGKRLVGRRLFRPRD